MMDASVLVPPCFEPCADMLRAGGVKNEIGTGRSCDRLGVTIGREGANCEWNHTQRPVRAGEWTVRRKDWFSSGTGLELQVVETVRLDVDHWFPLMIVSGSYSPGTFSANWGTVDWIATNLAATGKGVWEGQIVRRWGDTQLIPHTSVHVHAPPHIFFPFSGAKITITFTGGAADVTRTLRFESRVFSHG